MNQELSKYLCEYLYGLEYTKHDLQNCKRKYDPIFNGTRCLQIGTQKNSDHFCEAFMNLFESHENKREQLAKKRKDLKTHKDYEFVCAELEKTKQEAMNHKNILDKEYEEKLKGDIQETIPYKQLVYKYKMLNDTVSNCESLQHKIESLQEKLESAQCGSAEYELTLKENNKKILEKQKNKLISEFEKQRKDCDKLDVAEYKKKIKELEEKNKKLKKIIETSL